MPGATLGLDVSTRERRVDAVRLVTAALKYQPQAHRHEAMAELEAGMRESIAAAKVTPMRRKGAGVR